MKRFFFGLLAATLMVACNTNDKQATKVTAKDSAIVANAMADSSNYTTIEWLDSTYIDLGKHPEGKSVELSFRFRNNGNKNLVIRDVTAPCGCTIPEKPEKPFAPGEEGVIKAMYNGSGHGEIRKEVHVTANTSPNPAHTLSFRAELVKP